MQPGGKAEEDAQDVFSDFLKTCQLKLDLYGMELDMYAAHKLVLAKAFLYMTLVKFHYRGFF